MEREGTFIEWMAVRDIAKRFDPKNSKDHDVGEITESLKRFGYVRKIELNDHRSDKFVLLGHGTTKALSWLEKEGIDLPKGTRANNGHWEVQVIRGHKIPSKEAQAYRIADNRLTEIGGYNDPQLLNNLIEIETGRKGFRGIGFDGDFINHLQEIVHGPNKFPEYDEGMPETDAEAAAWATCPECGNRFLHEKKTSEDS